MRNPTVGHSEETAAVESPEPELQEDLRNAMGSLAARLSPDPLAVTLKIMKYLSAAGIPQRPSEKRVLMSTLSRPLGGQVEVDPRALDDQVVLRAGPLSRWEDVETFRQLFDQAPGFEVRLGIFKNGLYSVEGGTSDRDRLLEWLKGHEEVLSVAIHGDTLEIRPVEASVNA